jgi:hypothetical protein
MRHHHALWLLPPFLVLPLLNLYKQSTDHLITFHKWRHIWDFSSIADNLWKNLLPVHKNIITEQKPGIFCNPKLETACFSFRSLRTDQKNSAQLLLNNTNQKPTDTHTLKNPTNGSSNVYDTFRHPLHRQKTNHKKDGTKTYCRTRATTTPLPLSAPPKKATFCH